jgi:hypothetical protein
MEIVFVLRGQEVELDQLEDVRERAVLSEIARSLRDRVGGLRCAEHGAKPKLTATGSRADALEFELAGCCQELIERTTASLS